MRTIRLVGTLAALLLIGGSAVAADEQGFPVHPIEFDPEKTRVVESQWVTHEGLPDAGGSDHALYLQKLGPTALPAAAFAELKKVEDTVWQDQLGFDWQTDGHCGAGAPRFNVITDAGTTHFFGCIHGNMIPAGIDSQAHPWVRVRFHGTDAFPPIAVGTPIEAIFIVFDEGNDQGQGFVYLDNIFYNGFIMGKPGNGEPGS